MSLTPCIVGGRGRVRPVTHLPLLLLTLFAAGCATARGPSTFTGAPSDRVTVVIESHHWTADAIRFVCDGHRLRTIRGLSFDRTLTANLDLADCANVRIEVEEVAGPAHALPLELLFSPGDLVHLDLAPVLVHSAVWTASDR